MADSYEGTLDDCVEFTSELYQVKVKEVRTLIKQLLTILIGYFF